jgi:hypothetical protein
MERTYVDDIPEHAQDGVPPIWVSEDDIVEESAVPESTALAVVPQQRPRSVLAALSHAGVVAWRQPAVRAVVRTGASAVALSVALRVAGRLVTSRSARQIATQAALPGLTELLAPGEQRVARRGRDVEVSETFIYMRRITRR